MNVLQVIPSLDPADGGPSVALPMLAKALLAQSVEVTIATTTALSRGEERKEDGVRYLRFPRNTQSYKTSRQLASWLRSNVSEFDLIHIHALFSFGSTVAAQIARSKNVPYVVRPLGVLNRWGMENRRPLLKFLSFRTIELRILLNSVAIHYTSNAERDEAGLLDARVADHPLVVIPLPVELAASPTTQQINKLYPQLTGRKIILFMSRIDPKKGLELLLDAFDLLQRGESKLALVIAGDGDANYVKGVRGRSSARANSQNIFWVGHLIGELKTAALEGADVFVLPSASENFGIAATEALAAGVPTIISAEVGLSDDVRAYDAGRVVKRDVSEIARAISDLLSNQELARELAANGQRLVRERYSPDAVGRQLRGLYEAILSQRAGERPQ